jgi:hypothetical protein
MKGTRASIKSGLELNGGYTDMFNIDIGIKQGCPLAPLLFIIFMDPLHIGYNRFRGYDTGGGQSQTSAGYADDTWITHKTESGIRQMHKWTNTFMNWHNMDINSDKTHIVGIDKIGDECGLHLTYTHPDGSHSNIKPVALDRSIRYLGLLINMKLDWNDQIKSMTRSLMGVITKLNPTNFSILTACMTIKSILIPRLIIGMHLGWRELDFLIWSKAHLVLFSYGKTHC